jgi:hypothetical protein
MALVIGDNFSYQGPQPNFARDSFETLVAMRTFPETSLDEGHISFCLETGKRYQFSSSNTSDIATGKWRLIVDTALNESSENPVQNKIIYATLQKYEQDLEKSLGAYQAQIQATIDSLKEVISQYDDVIDSGNEVAAKGLSELRDTIDESNRIISAALNDIRIKSASIEVTINGHALSEGDITITKSDIGLGNVDNTSDINKPVSNAVKVELSNKVDKITNYGLIGDSDYTKLKQLPDAASIGVQFIEVNQAIDEHKADYSNPHKVTMAQIGVDVELDKKVDKTTTINNHELTGDITITKGDIVLGNVDNTADIDKPTSTQQQESINEKADELSEYVAASLTDLRNEIEDINKTVSQSLNELNKAIIPSSGTLEERPESVTTIGFCYFVIDTDNGTYYPSWWNGNEWITI